MRSVWHSSKQRTRTCIAACVPGEEAQAFADCRVRLPRQVSFQPAPTESPASPLLPPRPGGAQSGPIQVCKRSLLVWDVRWTVTQEMNLPFYFSATQATLPRSIFDSVSIPSPSCWACIRTLLSSWSLRPGPRFFLIWTHCFALSVISFKTTPATSHLWYTQKGKWCQTVWKRCPNPDFWARFTELCNTPGSWTRRKWVTQ